MYSDNQSGTGNDNQPNLNSTNTGRTSDVFKRKLSTYMDVDAPKVSVYIMYSCSDIIVIIRFSNSKI